MPSPSQALYVVGTVLCALGGSGFFWREWRLSEEEPVAVVAIPPGPRTPPEPLCPPCGRCRCECTCDEPSWDSERSAAVQRTLEERAIKAERCCIGLSTALCCAVAVLVRNSYVRRREPVSRFITNALMSAALESNKEADILRLLFPGPSKSSRRHGRSPPKL